MNRPDEAIEYYRRSYGEGYGKDMAAWIEHLEEEAKYAIRAVSGDEVTIEDEWWESEGGYWQSAGPLELRDPEWFNGTPQLVRKRRPKPIDPLVEAIREEINRWPDDMMLDRAMVASRLATVVKEVQK